MTRGATLLVTCIFNLSVLICCSKEQNPESNATKAICGLYNSLCDPRVDAMFQPELDTIWRNIVNQHQVLNSGPVSDKVESATSGTLHLSGTGTDDLTRILNFTTRSHPTLYGKNEDNDTQEVSKNINRDPRNRPLSSSGANVDMMNKIFTDLFLHPRSDDFDSDLKSKSRQGIIDRLSHYTLETTSQEFFAKTSNGKVIRGVNVVGVIPGKNRGKPGDEFILVGAHYDSDVNTPGVDDNGSGVVAMLEIARIMSPYMGKLSKSLLFVAFDLEEKGILGSLAFVNNYLIPHELVAKRAKFAGAYILEMVMNYDSSSSSQILPLDMVVAVPESALWLQLNGNRGDFVSIWSRKELDWPLNHAFHNSWQRVVNEAAKLNQTEPKLYAFDPSIPRDPLLLSTVRYRAFFNSDQASFWTHRSTDYSEYLSAVLITDMGAWRGNMRACYHEFCDDKRLLTPENLDFMKKITDATADAVYSLAE